MGTYSITVRVTDTHGNSTNATARLTVVGLPSLSSFVALPPTITIGSRSLLSAQVTGGSGAILYNYSHLPSGCSTQTVPTLPCSPSSAGGFSISVTATDSLGQAASATLTLTVTAAGTTGGPQITGASLIRPARDRPRERNGHLRQRDGGDRVLELHLQRWPSPWLHQRERFGDQLHSELPAESSRSRSPYPDGAKIPATVSPGTLTVFPGRRWRGARRDLGFCRCSQCVPIGWSRRSSLVAFSGGVAPLTYSYPDPPTGMRQ